MKTYKAIFSCKSILNEIPDAQKIFGAICNVIKNTQGDEALQRYLKSFEQEPEFVHSSMFPDKLFPSVKKNIFSLELIHNTVNQLPNKDKLNILSEYKQFKRLQYLHESIVREYILTDRLDALMQELIVHRNSFKIEDSILMKSNDLCRHRHEILLSTRNGSRANSMEKDLFYSKQMYFEEDARFCIYIKTTNSKSYIENIFKYLEYTGIGNRRSVGFNVFHLESIEEIQFTTLNSKKYLLSKCIPDETMDLEHSYYQIHSDIYHGSKDYVNNSYIGRFSSFIEGSLLKMEVEKEFYGKVVPVMIGNKKIYHYGIGFVL